MPRSMLYCLRCGGSFPIRRQNNRKRERNISRPCGAVVQARHAASGEPVLTPKQEAYCLARCRGLTQRQAYREAYPASRKWHEGTVDSRASELEHDSEVLGRLSQLRESAAKEARITRAQVIERLADLAEDAYERAHDADPGELRGSVQRGHQEQRGPSEMAPRGRARGAARIRGPTSAS